VDVLRNMVEAVKPGGTVLDLQVIRPNPRVELGGELICEIDGQPLFEKADAAVSAIEALIAARRLIERARDDHDVRKHYRTGADLVDDLAPKERRVPDEAVPLLRAVTEPCVIRERCRLRRLERMQVLGG
jgi:hypothetical protein